MTRSHLNAVLTALFVTVLWSSSWVLIKWGLADIRPLAFAGMRYALAALLLAPILVMPSNRKALAACGPRRWGLLIGFGLLQYAVLQGAQFTALALLPATMLSLMFAFTPLLVMMLGAAVLGERFGVREGLGVGVFLAGAGLYFGGAVLPAVSLVGLAVGAAAVLANAAQNLLGRKVNRDTGLPPSLITAVSMAAGGVVLLGAGVAVEGWPAMTPRAWLIVGWLAAANTALAFWLWNRAQVVISALEASLINNTMMIQIAVLAVVVLGERLTAVQIAGLTLASGGVLWVQVTRMRASAAAARR